MASAVARLLPNRLMASIVNMCVKAVESVIPATRGGTLRMGQDGTLPVWARAYGHKSGRSAGSGKLLRGVVSALV
jgi:hypothetical protein